MRGLGGGRPAKDPVKNCNDLINNKMIIKIIMGNKK
jgi:hypothetical protein